MTVERSRGERGAFSESTRSRNGSLNGIGIEINILRSLKPMANDSILRLPALTRIRHIIRLWYTQKMLLRYDPLSIARNARVCFYLWSIVTTAALNIVGELAFLRATCVLYIHRLGLRQSPAAVSREIFAARSRLIFTHHYLVLLLYFPHRINRNIFHSRVT